MRGRENRFTLIEVLVALAVTGIAAMGILRLQVIGIEAALHSELTGRAAVIAESQLEQAIAAARADREPPQPDSGDTVLSELNVEYRWELEVEEVSGDFLEDDIELRNLWRMTCRVSWRDNSHHVELTRYLWDYDLVQ